MVLVKTEWFFSRYKANVWAQEELKKAKKYYPNAWTDICPSRFLGIFHCYDVALFCSDDALRANYNSGGSMAHTLLTTSVIGKDLSWSLNPDQSGFFVLNLTLHIEHSMVRIIHFSLQNN